MELATCMFNKRGLTFCSTTDKTIHQKFTEAEYEFSRKNMVFRTASRLCLSRGLRAFGCLSAILGRG